MYRGNIKFYDMIILYIVSLNAAFLKVKLTAYQIFNTLRPK